MVTTSHMAMSHIKRVLLLTTLFTYFAPMVASVETGLIALAQVSMPSQAGVTIAYEEFKDSSKS